MPMGRMAGILFSALLCATIAEPAAMESTRPASKDIWLPASLVKCLLATAAGILFAFVGVLFEHLREQQANAVPGHSACSQKPIAILPCMSSDLRGPCMSVDMHSKSETTHKGHNIRQRSASQHKMQPGSHVRWVPPSNRQRCVLSSAESAERQVKSILNKLTLEKYDALYEQLLSCCNEAPSRAEIIEVVAKEVFTKATREHCFIDLYAKVCLQLHQALCTEETDGIDFKQVLLGHCKASFKEYLEPLQIDTSLGGDAQYEQRVKCKTKMLGNVRLIGQLLLFRMLNPQIIFHCAEELLRVRTAECLETLCAFLSSIGNTFDTAEWEHIGKFGEVFVRVEILVNDPHTCPRMKCLLQDVLDARKQGWPKSHE